MEIKKVKIKNTEYTLQQVSAFWFLDYSEKYADVKTKYIQGLFDNVIVSPKGVKISDFDGKIREMMKLVGIIEKFIMGEELNDDDIKDLSVEEIKNVSTPEEKAK